MVKYMSFASFPPISVCQRTHTTTHCFSSKFDATRIMRLTYVSLDVPSIHAYLQSIPDIPILQTNQSFSLSSTETPDSL